MNIYEREQTLESKRFLVRLMKSIDCDDLLKVYSDKMALPFFNTDNCDEENFYYTDDMQMYRAMTMWHIAFSNHWFARLSIYDKESATVIGTIEVCKRVSDDEFNNKGILRVDVRSDYEKTEYLYELFELVTPHMKDLVECDGVITKAPTYAIDRIEAVKKAGYKKSEHYLIGKNGYAYDGYFVIEN